MTGDPFAAIPGGWDLEAWVQQLRRQEHPRVFLDGVAMADARRRAEQPGWLADRVRALRLDAEQLVPPVLPQLVNGHGHEFFCEAGHLLTPLPDGSGGLCAACGRSHVGERYAQGAAWFVDTAAVHAALVLGAAHALTGSSGYAKAAADLLLQFAGLFRRHGQTARQTLDEAWRLSALAFVYEEVRASSALGQDVRGEIEEGLIRAAAERVLAGYDPVSNWGACHDAGLGIAGAVLGERTYLEMAVRGFVRRAETYFHADGLGVEGSIGTYHMMTVANMITLAEALRPTGLDLYAARRGGGDGPRILEAVLDAPLGLAFRDGRLPALHDGWYLHGNMLNPDLYEIGWSRYGKRTYRLAADTLYGVERFGGEERGPEDGRAAGTHGWLGNPPVLPSYPWVWDYFVRSVFVPAEQWLRAPARHFPPREFWAAWRPAPGPSVADVAPGAGGAGFSPPSAHFPDGGLVVLRADRGDASIVLDYGPHGGGHGHPDKGGIVLYAGGRVLVPDYGTPAYGLAISGRWYRRTLSHNTVVMDARDQAPCQGTLRHLELGGPCPTAVVALDAAYPGSRWRRQVSMVEGLVLVVDDLGGEEVRTFDWLLRSRGTLALPEGLTPDGGGDPHLETTDLHDPCWYRGPARGSLAWQDGEGVGLALWWEVALPPRLLAARAPGFPLERLDPMIALRTRGARSRYTVLLEPFRGEGRAVADLGAEGASVRIALAGGRTLAVPVLV